MRPLKFIFLLVAGMSLLSSGCAENSNKQPDDSIKAPVTNEMDHKENTLANISTSHKKNVKTAAPYIAEQTENSMKNKVFIKIKGDFASVNVRAEPSFTEKPIALLKGGDVVEKLAGREKWTKIRFKGPKGDLIIGWIRNSMIDIDKNKANPKLKLRKSKPKKHDSPKQDQLSPI